MGCRSWTRWERTRAIRSSPKETRAGRKIISATVKDFLSAWLVEQRPGMSVHYEMAPFRILKAMAEAIRVIGKVSSLHGVVHPVRLDNPRLQLAKHVDRALVFLYRVPTALGDAICCEEGFRMSPDLAPPTDSDRYGRFYASAFYLSIPIRQGATLYMLWEREDKNRKIVASKIEPDKAPPMDTRPAPRRSSRRGFGARCRRSGDDRGRHGFLHRLAPGAGFRLEPPPHRTPYLPLPELLSAGGHTADGLTGGIRRLHLRQHGRGLREDGPGDRAGGCAAHRHPGQPSRPNGPT